MSKKLNTLAKKYGVKMDEGKTSIVDKSLSKEKLRKIKCSLKDLPSETQSLKNSIDSITDSIERSLNELTNTQKNSENEDSLKYLEGLLKESREVRMGVHRIEQYFDTK